MLDALKQLIGLAPRDTREVWHDKPVVITDAEGEIVFSGITSIEYTPSQTLYEEGHATIYDPATGDPLLELNLAIQLVNSAFDQRGPYRTRWARFGVTADATNPDAQHFRLYVGRNAYTYARNHAVGIFPADTIGDFAGGEVGFDPQELEGLRQEREDRRREMDDE